ncbi:MAG: hypothetical protein ACRD0U_15355 [Acidimicrobiales bacterium]
MPTTSDYFRGTANWWWRAWLGMSLAIGVGVAGSGLALARWYRPATTRHLRGASGPDPELFRSAHQGLSTALVVVLLLGVLFVAGRTHTARSGRPCVALLAIAALGVTAAASGFVLGWDYLALRVVTIGADYRGVLRAAFSDRIRYVVVNGDVLSQGAYRLRVLWHVAVIPAALVGASAVLWRSRRLR